MRGPLGAQFVKIFVTLSLDILCAATAFALGKLGRFFGALSQSVTAQQLSERGIASKYNIQGFAGFILTMIALFVGFIMFFGTLSASKTPFNRVARAPMKSYARSVVRRFLHVDP